MKLLSRWLSMSLLALLFTAPSALAQDDDADFTQAELDQILAPIALYPDVLLSQILMASTYPLEIVEAARWSRNNPDLEGEAAVDAVAGMDWDPSVKALVAFPQVLERMYEDLDWTTSLGDAFLYQEAQVMDSIQGLRQRAHEAGNLESTDNIKVVRERETIIIEPARPQVVYVPYYNPRVIYGGWWWPAYPPVYWGPPPGYFAYSGFYWGRGIHVSLGFFFSSFDWHRRHTVVIHHHHHHFHKPHFVGGKHVRYATYPKWRHNPKHRRGVAYRHRSVQREYGRHRTSSHARSDSRHWTSGSRSSSYRTGSRDSRQTSAIGRTDDRRLAGRTDDRQLAGRTESRNFTRGDRDRRSGFSRTPAGERDATRLNRDRTASRGVDDREPGANRTRDAGWSHGNAVHSRSGASGDRSGRTWSRPSQAATDREGMRGQRSGQSSNPGATNFGFNLGQQPGRAQVESSGRSGANRDARQQARGSQSPAIGSASGDRQSAQRGAGSNTSRSTTAATTNRGGGTGSRAPGVGTNQRRDASGTPGSGIARGQASRSPAAGFNNRASGQRQQAQRSSTQATRGSAGSRTPRASANRAGVGSGSRGISQQRSGVGSSLGNQNSRGYNRGGAGRSANASVGQGRGNRR